MFIGLQFYFLHKIHYYIFVKCPEPSWRTSILPVHPCQDKSENRMKSNLYFILK